MTLPAGITLLSTGIALFFAIQSLLFSRAPGWRDQRYFSLAALAVSLYAALNIPTTAPVLGDGAVVICSRLQIAAAALHTAAWLRYTSVLVRNPRSSVDRFLLGALGAVAVVGVLTPAMVPGGVRTDVFAALRLSYRTADMSPAGDATWAALLGLLAIPIFRLSRASRMGVPNARVQFAALCFLLVIGANDALVASGVYPGPYLVDLAYLVPIAAVGYSTATRFVADAQALATLRGRLEAQVAEQTAELGQAQEALHRAEKLAALGQVAAGVAHEVNNPSAVVSANLQYLSEAEAEALSLAGRDAIQESIQSVQRITSIVRQLLDAGRLAASTEPNVGVAARPLGENALKTARTRLGQRVALVNALPADLYVSGQESVLVQVLVNLVVNAMQSIPDHRTDGQVILRAELEPGRARLVVEDNGAGMEPEVLRRVFEPFFTTKPFGSGTGLGLAVSRGLVVSLGGDLRLESLLGKGTRAIVELARCGAPEAPVAGPAAVHRGAPTLRLLIVDDEPSVLSAARRLLEARYRVEIASGVEEGLARIEAPGRFDMVLCDVMMPSGGGERLYNTLLARVPAMARRIVFLTGGAVTDGARRFLRDQPQPVLHKPIDLGELARAAEAVAGAASSALH
jgi:signal transduction histidine kinase/ActR/RegA family two-component response regulator